MMAKLTASEKERYKREAAVRAAELVEPGMLIGLGSGSTSAFAVSAIGEKIVCGDLPDVRGIPSSARTRVLAEKHGIPLSEFIPGTAPDVVIDGADEIDPDFNLIKGGGGALLREKILAQAAKRFIVIADSSKRSPQLGRLHAVPVEILPFARVTETDFLEDLGASVHLRLHDDKTVYTTEQNNFILDCDFGPLSDANIMAQKLDSRAGILAHGLFTGLADELIIAGPGGIEHQIKRGEK